MLLTDILDLLKFQPKPLEYYGKYSLVITIPILLAIGLAYGFFVPIDPAISINTSIAINLIFMPIVWVCLILFFKYWLGRRQKIFTFQALFSVFVLASIVDFLCVPLELLDINTYLYWVLFIALFCYSFAILIFAIARGAEVSFSYSLAGTLIGTVILIILMVLLTVAFIVLGLITMPPVPV